MDIDRPKPTVAVVGTGSMGAMALWQLAKRGVPVVGFEAFSPGHDRGAAGGESRIFRMAYKEGAEYVPLLKRAREMWGEVDRLTEHTLFYSCGFATVGPADDPQIASILESARVHNLEVEILDADEARRRVPEHPVRSGETLVYDPNGGLIRPELAVLTVAHRAEALGAEIRRYTKVLDVVEAADHVTVVTDAGSESFDQVIVASGPWVHELSPVKRFPIQPRELTATWFPRRSSDLFVLGRSAAAVRVGTPGFSCFPAVDGSNVKVIAHGAFADILGPDQLPRAGTAENSQRAAAFVEETLPGVFPTPVRVQTYSDGYTPDSTPVFGRIGPSSRIIVASGFSGHGFKMAPAFGEALADVVENDRTDGLEFMSPNRF